MKDRDSQIYRTTGSKEAAPYGLVDDEYHFVTTSGAEFHMWSEETHHLFSAIHQFQWSLKLIPLPELPIVTLWNTLQGVFGGDSTPTEIDELPTFIEALRILQSHYADYDTAGKHDGFAALSVADLEAFISFNTKAARQGETVRIIEY